MRTAASAGHEGDPVRRRLSAAARERQILDGAIRFFAARGLDGQLRELAKEIGITHTLLYHYFPTKQKLVERIYAQWFEGRWNPAWETLLDDTRQPVEQKMTTFYCAYANEVLSAEWIRILIFSGLADRYIPDQFFALLRKRLFPRLIRETRRFRGVQTGGRPSARELELLMGLHGGIFYVRLRRWVYGQAVHSTRTPQSEQRIIADRVRAYLISARALLDGEPSSARAARGPTPQRPVARNTRTRG